VTGVQTCALPISKDQSVKDIIQNLEGDLIKIGQQKHLGWKAAPDLVNEAYKEIETTVYTKRVLTGIDTGFSDLNQLTLGFHPGELIIIAGRPGHGKTSLVGNIVDHHILKSQGSVGVFSLEMTGRELIKRSIYSESETDCYRLPSLDYRNSERVHWGKIQEACGALTEAHLWIDDSGGLTIGELRSRAQRLMLQHKIDFLVIDYLQLMAGSGQRNSTREREISEISRGLKGMAKDMQIPIVALSQLNREIEKTSRRPQLSDLRESGAIEQDADVVLFIWREEARSKSFEDAGKAELIIGKNRNGRSGKIIILNFHQQWCKFTSQTWRSETLEFCNG
jgi:replicative DNA helicase